LAIVEPFWCLVGPFKAIPGVILSHFGPYGLFWDRFRLLWVVSRWFLAIFGCFNPVSGPFRDHFGPFHYSFDLFHANFVVVSGSYSATVGSISAVFRLFEVRTISGCFGAVLSRQNFEIVWLSTDSGLIQEEETPKRVPAP
jgi:hypothetical protein